MLLDIAPERPPEPPRPDTDELLRAIVAKCGYDSKKTSAGYRITVPISGDRKQKVHVLFNGRDGEGHDTISFLSICGPASDRHAMSLLRLNSKLTFAALAVRKIKDEEYIVVTANQLAGTADREEIRKMLSEVAKRADAVERKLTDGKDEF